MELRIIDLMHLCEGDDIVADVLKIDCDQSHNHVNIGEAINFKIQEIDHIQLID